MYGISWFTCVNIFTFSIVYCVTILTSSDFYFVCKITLGVYPLIYDLQQELLCM